MNEPAPGFTPSTRKPWASTIAAAALAFLFVYPFVWMALAGFKANTEIFRPLDLFPSSWDPVFYKDLLKGEWFPFGRVYFNSLIIASVQACGAVLLGALAGYTFAWQRFRGRGLLFMIASVTIVIPPSALAVPMFEWMNMLQLTDHLASVILPGTVSGLSVIYFTQIFRHVPGELVEASRMAGASEWRTFATLLPLISSALLAFGLIQFILAWHDHLLPLLMLSAAEHQTLPLALSSLYGSSMRFPYAALMAGGVFSALPTAALFILLHRRLKSALADVLR